MVDVAALLKSLPVSGLEPQCVAILDGFSDKPQEKRWQDNIRFLEPPAGQHVPYIDPAQALEILLRRQDAALEEGQARAREAVARMRDEVANERWVNFFDDLEPETPDCLPVPDFVAWLRDEPCRENRLAAEMRVDTQSLKELNRKEVLVPSDLLDFFEQAAEVAASTPMFRGPDNWNEAWSLENLPTLPPPKAMIEFVPGAPWADIYDWGDWKATDNPFMRWREAIRPVALELEKALGEPVYHFADLNCDTDDDDVHRFLVLHWCCTHKPESAFVRYLLKVSGAGDVDELKAALIDPASYTQAFRMNDSFIGLETLFCRIEYLPPGKQKTVAILFSTPQAREVAQSLLAQKIGARAFIVAPKELATGEWVRQATRYCRDWTAHYLDDNTLGEPLEILALADELCVIANEQTPGRGFDLKLSEGAEDLLWLALGLGIDAKYFHVERTQLMNPETSLEKRGVPARVAARKAQRAAFARQFKEIRLDNDFGSSGLWAEDGKMLRYDQLDLPFPLVRRIAAWQRDDDDHMTPPDDGGEAWWKRHAQEAFEIAEALQAVLGAETAVKLHHAGNWMTVDQITRVEEGER